MKRVLVVLLIILTLFLAGYFFNQYWTHRYDALIARQAAIYGVDGLEQPFSLAAASAEMHVRYKQRPKPSRGVRHNAINSERPIMCC